MSENQNRIQWGLIIRSSVIAALVAVIVVLGLLLLLQQNPSTVLASICPPTLVQLQPNPGANIVEAIFTAIIGGILWVGVCALILSVYGMIVYFPLAIVLAVVLVGSRVTYRRVLHVVLTVLLSIPIAFAIFYGLVQLLNALNP
jgi:hypothetical protein